MKPTNDDIRRRLGLREVPKPPDDLVRRLKADIPPSFRYTNHAASGRKGDASSAAFRGMSWQVAASFLVLTLAGVGVYMVTFETEKLETARIAEADKAPSMEFSPPTSPAAGAPATSLAAETPALQKTEPRTAFPYDIPPPPPPPPPAPRKSRAEAPAATGIGGGVEGSVEGGVHGGVAGGVLGGVVGGVVENEADVAAAESRPTADDYAREKPAETQAAGGRDREYAEEKGVAARAPAPAVAAAPAGGAAKDEKTDGAQREPHPALSSAVTESIESLRAKAAAGEPLRVGGPVKAPVIVRRVELAYPALAKEARVQGVVIVETIVDRNGNVRSAKVLKPLPMGLDEAALAAVRQWKFKPGTLEGKPVDVIFMLTVNAKLAQ